MQHKRLCYLMALKDMFYVFGGSELSDGFPGIAHHVADDLRLNGVPLLTNFQLCLILLVRTEPEHESQLTQLVG